MNIEKKLKRNKISLHLLKQSLNKLITIKGRKQLLNRTFSHLKKLFLKNQIVIKKKKMPLNKTSLILNKQYLRRQVTMIEKKQQLNKIFIIMLKQLMEQMMVPFLGQVHNKSFMKKTELYLVEKELKERKMLLIWNIWKKSKQHLAFNLLIIERKNHRMSSTWNFHKMQQEVQQHRME